MVVEHLHDREWQRDDSMSRSRFGRPKSEVAGDFNADLGYFDPTVENVNAASAQASELADPESAIGGDEDERPIAGASDPSLI